VTACTGAATVVGGASVVVVGATVVVVGGTVVVGRGGSVLTAVDRADDAVSSALAATSTGAPLGSAVADRLSSTSTGTAAKVTASATARRLRCTRAGGVTSDGAASSSMATGGAS
jgi:hypothetical protein